jgi:hypothetical protein
MLGALRAIEVAALDEREHYFLDEEGIAPRTLVDLLGETRQGWIAAEEIDQQLLGRPAAQRQERQLAIVRPTHPLGVVLRPEVDEHERPRAAHRLDRLREKSVAAGVDPLRVVDHQHARLALATCPYQLADEGHELPLARLRTEPRHRARRIGHAEEIEHQRHGLLEALVE